MNVPTTLPFSIHVAKVHFAASNTERYCDAPTDPPDPNDKFMCQIQTKGGKVWHRIKRKDFATLLEGVK